MYHTKKGFFEAVWLGKNEFWRYLVVFLAVVLGYIIGQLPLTLIMMMKVKMDDEMDLSETVEKFRESSDFGIFGLDPNLGLFLVLLSFVGGLIMLLLMVQLIHKRSPLTLVNFSGSFGKNKILYGFSVWIFLCFLVEVLFLIIDPAPYEFNFSPTPFLILLAIAIFVLPLQTSMEELFFRGWLMQGLGMIHQNKFAPLILSSILFALIHSANPEVVNYGYWPMMMYYVLAGLFLALITILDDSLELALGVHFATNFYSAVFFSYEGAALKTPALFKSTEDINVMGLNLAFICIAAVFTAMAFRKYNWTFATLFEKISEPEMDREI